MRRFLSQLGETQRAGYEFIRGGPVVLKRCDINSVMPSSGKILNERRIREALRTSIELRKAGAVAITDGSHQSRIGKSDFYPTIEHSRVMNRILEEEHPNDFENWKYVFNESCWGVSQFEYLARGCNVLSNNIRFATWELNTPPNLEIIPPVRLIQKLQKAGHQIAYVQDAFASAHRGGNKRDTSMYELPTFLKTQGIEVFPSRHFVEEMQKYATVNELIHQSKKVVVALFGAKVKDYLDVLTLYEKQDNIEFIAGSLLTLIFLKSQNPSLDFGVNEERFFKDIGKTELKQFNQHFDPARIHLAQDLLLSTADEVTTMALTPQTTLRKDVQGIGPDSVSFFSDVVAGAQLFIINGCPFNINRFDEFGQPFKEFMTNVRKHNGDLTIYECGGDAITAIEFTGVSTNISSTAGKLGLLAPMIESEEDLHKFAPSVLPFL